MNPSQIHALTEHYAPFEQKATEAHITHLFILPNCRITIYQTGKVLFQGKAAQQESNRWQNEKLTEPSTPQATTTIHTYIGCDETGVGDYFMPLVATACFIDDAIRQQLETLNIKDSKQLEDTYIQQIVPTLKKVVPHATFILANEKYNDFIDHGYNAHAIKAFVHNKAITQLIAAAKLPPTIDIIMDQFASKKNYQKYLKDIDPVYVPTIFETKAENKYLGVAIASMIARATFLEIGNQKEQQYQVAFPLGASKKVDVFGVQFLQQFGEAEFKKNVKWHFANTKKIFAQYQD